MPRCTRGLSDCSRWLPLLVLTGGCASVFGAAFVPEQLAVVREMMPALESADFETRVSASKRLHEDPRIDLDAIGAAMAEPGVTPEQAQRLMSAFKAKFALGARPALGVGLALPTDDDRGIAIVELNRGLPAIDGGLIQWGDLLVALDGAKTVVSDPGLPQVVRQQMALDRTISLIQSYRPGETVTLEILRLKDRTDLLRERAALWRQAGDGAAAEAAREEHGAEPRDGLDGGGARADQGVVPEVDAVRFQREDIRLLKPTQQRERIEVRVPLGYYADLAPVRANRVDANQNFPNLIGYYGEAAMQARLNRLGVRWPGSTPIAAAERIDPGHALAPPAYTARLALGLDGAGHDPAAQDSRSFGSRYGLVFQGVDQAGRQIFRAPNGLVHVPRGLDVQVIPGRPPAADAVGARRVGGPGAAPAGAGDGSLGAGTGEPGGAPMEVGLGVDPAVGRGLARLAQLTSELARAERHADDPSLDPPTQREAERRAAELRRAVADLVDAVSKGQAGRPGFPTAEMTGDASAR